MRIIGIIAEYNPFHNGHLFHLKESKKRANADVVVAVMSGDFVQRGEPAALDKWTRSRLAVECGVDLVLELPFVYACNSAQYFAKGGVGILNGLGCVTHLSFGVESEKPEELQTLARFLAKETPAFKTNLTEHLAKGKPYAKAREEAITHTLGKEYAAIITSPNQILAVEYLRQLECQKSKMQPLFVPRIGPGDLDQKPEDTFASATAIRNHIPPADRSSYVPEPVAEAAEDLFLDNRLFFQLLQGELLRQEANELAEIFSVGEGLEHKLKQEVRYATSLDDLVNRVKSKRYPETRIRRIFCHILMHLCQFEDGFYGRVLAFNTKGAKILNHIKKENSSSIPMITNINKEKDKLPPIASYDLLASDLYHLFTKQDLYQNSDYVKIPFVKG